jgi:hypothetical protein
MEDILSLYEQPYDLNHPLVCFDERPCQLIENVLVPLPMQPGTPQREDYEYRRNGTCCLFIAFEPLTGYRVTQVRERRTKVDYAQFMKELVEQHYPEVKSIRLVQDNLNTHSPGSFYEAFAPDEAFHLAQKFECHYTPKKGSWLNMAEIELAVVSKQCLDRRLRDRHALASEIQAWEQQRNAIRATVHWRFTKQTARERLARHYPVMQH